MMGFIFAIVAVSVPFINQRIRDDRRLAWAVGVVLLVHQVTSALQVITGGLPTQRMDALSFHRFGVFGEGKLHHELYAHFLHAVYSLFGESHWLGCQISQIFFGIAIIAMVELIHRLGRQAMAAPLILLFGLLPSCILNTSVTLREAGQVAMYLTLTCVLLDVNQRGLKSNHALLFPTALVLFCLHQGFAVLLIVTVPMALAWSLRAKPQVLAGMSIVALSGSFLYAEKAINFLLNRSGALRNISTGNLEYVEQYATKVGTGRTDLGVSLDFSSLGAFLYSGPLLLFYYLFSPLPWQVRDMVDLYGMFESFIRLGLFVGALKLLKDSRGQCRSDLLLLGFMFLTMEMAWAAGTANWGTAFRHRLVAWGILVVMGGPAFLSDPKVEEETEERTVPTTAGSVRERRRALRRKGVDAAPPGRGAIRSLRNR